MHLVLATLLFAGCSTGTPLHEKTFTVACGMCIFKLGATTGCYWAAEVEGGHLPVTGIGIPLDHKSHSSGGMCTMPRQAKITGTLYQDKIFADVFELVPIEHPEATVEHTHKH